MTSDPRGSETPAPRFPVVLPVRWHWALYRWLQKRGAWIVVVCPERPDRHSTRYSRKQACEDTRRYRARGASLFRTGWHGSSEQATCGTTAHRLLFFRQRIACILSSWPDVPSVIIGELVRVASARLDFFGRSNPCLENTPYRRYSSSAPVAAGRPGSEVPLLPAQVAFQYSSRYSRNSHRVARSGRWTAASPAPICAPRNLILSGRFFLTNFSRVRSRTGGRGWIGAGFPSLWPVGGFPSESAIAWPRSDINA